MADSRIPKGAIIGFGNAAQHSHWPAYTKFPGATIVAVVDSNEKRREEARKLCPSLETFATLDDLANRGQQIDFVDICTPPAFHGEAIMQALSNGWHVLCEKPLLLNQEMLVTAREKARRGQPVLRTGCRPQAAGKSGRSVCPGFENQAKTAGAVG